MLRTFKLYRVTGTEYCLTVRNFKEKKQESDNYIKVCYVIVKKQHKNKMGKNPVKVKTELLVQTGTNRQMVARNLIFGFSPEEFWKNNL